MVMEKRNVVENDRTPCVCDSTKSCECPKCARTKAAGEQQDAPRGIHDVDGLSKEHGK